MAETKAPPATTEPKAPAAYLAEARKILDGDATIPDQREHLMALRPELLPAPLGDPQVYAKLSPDGKLVVVKATLCLKEELGHLYEVKGKVGISSVGYHELNRYAAVSLVGPVTLSTPEGERPNPWLEMDEKTGYVKAVRVRRVAFGLSPIGSLAVIDRSFRYDLRTYLVEEAVKAAVKTPSMGTFMLADQVAEYEQTEKKRGWFVRLGAPAGA